MIFIFMIRNIYVRDPDTIFIVFLLHLKRIVGWRWSLRGLIIALLMFTYLDDFDEMQGLRKDECLILYCYEAMLMIILTQFMLPSSITITVFISALMVLIYLWL